MADITWPSDLAPFVQAYFLQPHVGGSESPFSRARKIYELSAPRWVSTMSFRGGYAGSSGEALYGGRLDAMLVRLRGGVNRALVYDFRRPTRTGLGPALEDSDILGEEFGFTDGSEFSDGTGFIVTWSGGPPASLAAAQGATTMTWRGFTAGTLAFNPGDYVGGDGRAHLVTVAPVVDGEGNVTVTFEPPLDAAIDAGDGIFTQVTSPFRLVSDEAGANATEVGGPIGMDFQLVEDL